MRVPKTMHPPAGDGELAAGEELDAGWVARVQEPVKHIGFLSFGHWSTAPGSQVRSASDSLLQSIELAVAAEEIGTAVIDMR